MKDGIKMCRPPDEVVMKYDMKKREVIYDSSRNRYE